MERMKEKLGEQNVAGVDVTPVGNTSFGNGFRPSASLFDKKVRVSGLKASSANKPLVRKNVPCRPYKLEYGKMPVVEAESDRCDIPLSVEHTFLDLHLDLQTGEHSCPEPSANLSGIGSSVWNESSSVHLAEPTDVSTAVAPATRTDGRNRKRTLPDGDQTRRKSQRLHK